MSKHASSSTSEVGSSDDYSDSSSLLTITSSLAEELVQVKSGVRYTALSEHYNLPYTDDTALAEQLSLLCCNNFTNGLGYHEPPDQPGEVGRLLDAGGRMLDVGSGMEGLFAVQMAQRHPNAEVIGIDLIPTLTLTERRFVPPNASFEVADVTDGGLPFPDGWFAFVSMRFISPWIPDYPKLIDEARRVLAPGGILVALEHGCELHTLTGLSIPWFQLSVKDSREDPDRVKDIVPSPLEHAHQVFNRLQEIIVESGADEGTEEGFADLSVLESDLHLGARAETDDDQVLSQTEEMMRVIILLHWRAQLLTLDGRARPSKALLHQIGMITERSSGLFQTARCIWARKKRGRQLHTGDDCEMS